MGCIGTDIGAEASFLGLSTYAGKIWTGHRCICAQ